MPPRKRRAPLGKACTECGKPVVVAPGDRHLSCSPRCTVCYAPIPSTDPTDDPTVHAAPCAKKHPTK